MADIANELNAVEAAAVSNMPVVQHVVDGVAAEVGATSLGAQLDGYIAKAEAAMAFVNQHKATIEALTDAMQTGNKSEALGAIAKALFSSIL